LFSEVVCSTALKTETVPAQLEIEIWFLFTSSG